VSRSFSLPFYPRLMSQAFSIFRPPPAPFAPANAKVSEPAACTYHVSLTARPVTRYLRYRSLQLPDTVAYVQTENRACLMASCYRGDPRELPFSSLWPDSDTSRGKRWGSVAMRYIVNTSIVARRSGVPFLLFEYMPVFHANIGFTFKLELEQI